ncbi:MAG: serine/threonine protein kinase [Planctomycetes bacterium]|nr:serine/threonine protein kinase [Planctomycetota bacterium]
MSEGLSEPNLRLGLLAIRNEFVNLSELKHCIDVRKKLYAKNQQALDLGDVLVQQRYLTPQDLEYLHMQLAAADGGAIDLAAIEAEFDKHVAELKPGCEFGAYKIEEEIGRGGMGIVFRASRLDEPSEACALKILIGGKDATVRDIERFKKEATVMAPLLHNGIVKIHEVGRHKGLDFISMEFIEGVSLKELVGDKPLPDEMALMIIRSAGEAVSFMHSHGIIHRDIKPENIMVRPDGSAVLMDFGLAGWEKIEVLAGRGSIGTPMYQPPEQADVGGPFGKISEASDVYGLGASLYYLLTARHPFLGKSVQEVRQKIKTTPPDPIGQSNAKVHAAAEALCLRCLKKRQGERFSTPRELIENIDKVLGLLLAGDPGGREARKQALRRIAAATRRRSESGPVARRSDAGKKVEARAAAARPATKSTAKGKVLPSQKRARAGRPAGGEAGPSGGIPPAVIIAGVAVLVVLILGGVLALGG